MIDSRNATTINQMSYDSNIREESLKLKVASDWFPKFDCTDIVNRIDFAVKIKRKANVTDNPIDFGDEYLLWAEAKQQPTDIYRMLAQLILTIYQDARNDAPPKFIGCFDNEKIAFVQYHYVLPIFNLNDFNWTQTPSAVDEKTVETVYKGIDKNQVFVFRFDSDKNELQNFVKQNFTFNGAENLLATQIDRNNFIFVYQKWRSMVMPNINANWDLLKKNYSIYDRDFFLAELNIDDNETADISDDKTANGDFYITFDAKNQKPYTLNRKDGLGLDVSYNFGFKNNNYDTYSNFWKRYKRPPQKEEWNFITNRLDLLVPQDVRERKGAFFTPQIWVEKSQQYIADVLGEKWQEEYYVWDCCAGTGNLLNGLTNKYNIWASTLDQQDVDVMYERIANGAQLVKEHVFQFDFLNDDFSKLPKGLQDIINTPEKRKKLVVYINPPYAEHGNRKTINSDAKHKAGVAIENKVSFEFQNIVGGNVTRELFAQFFLRIKKYANQCVLASFSTLKYINSQDFVSFRKFFNSSFKKGFICNSKTFDNVNGKFPIGFLIWDLDSDEKIDLVDVDVFDDSEKKIGKKVFYPQIKGNYISDWLRLFYDKNGKDICYLILPGVDMQQQSGVYITIKPTDSDIKQHKTTKVTTNNLFVICIYLSVRQCIELNWVNNRDQFLFPNDGWKTDKEFQNDCLAFTLFHGQNKITSEDGANHWIPFTEREVNARDKFDSNFMTDFMRGKCAPTANNNMELFATETESYIPTEPLQFSAEATAVFDAGRELWRYYHTMEDANPNASLYDIKAYFQGRNDKGKMNTTSNDAHYMELIKTLRAQLKILAEKIQPKVYEYGFLK